SLLAFVVPSLVQTVIVDGPLRRGQLRVNPQNWLADVLDRIGRGHPINRLDELLPWNWVAPVTT
ncbi:transposase domain-containing protein, partial [Sphingomonas olei]